MNLKTPENGGCNGIFPGVVCTRPKYGEKAGFLSLMDREKYPDSFLDQDFRFEPIKRITEEQFSKLVKLLFLPIQERKEKVTEMLNEIGIS